VNQFPRWRWFHSVRWLIRFHSIPFVGDCDWLHSPSFTMICWNSFMHCSRSLVRWLFDAMLVTRFSGGDKPICCSTDLFPYIRWLWYSWFYHLLIYSLFILFIPPFTIFISLIHSYGHPDSIWFPIPKLDSTIRWFHFRYLHLNGPSINHYTFLDGPFLPGIPCWLAIEQNNSIVFRLPTITTIPWFLPEFIGIAFPPFLIW